MKKFGTIFLLGFLCLLLTSQKEAKATHAAGMEMFYRWKQVATSDSTYEFTVIFYRRCNAAPAPTSVVLKSASQSTSRDYNTNLPRLATTGSGVPPLQPANMYNCTNESTLCYEEYVYRGDWTSQGKANDWVFSTTICCRPGPGGTWAPDNIPYSWLWVESGLNNLDFPDATAKNWSPLWHNRRPNHPGYTTDTVINYLFRTLCAGNYYTLDMSVREYQGDSVSYEFYNPQGINGTDILFNSPYSITNPFPKVTPAGPLVINPTTGIIPIVPDVPAAGENGIYVMGIKAIEWRYDTVVSGGSFALVPKQIGFNKRDMTIWIDDNTTCRRDSVHPKDIVVNIDAQGENKTIDVFFSTGNSNDPNSLVRCASISPDGSEFRILDSSNYVAPFDTTVRSIGVHKATWTCQAGVTEKVTLHLAEPLKCNTYTLMLKRGTDLDVLESECGFLEPEFTHGKIVITKDINVELEGVGDRIMTCWSNDTPYPELKAISSDSASFPLEYFWTFNGDTVEDHPTNVFWPKETGSYSIKVRGARNCTGEEEVEIFFDQKPEFYFAVQPYCDREGEVKGMPDYVVAPVDENPNMEEWEWFQVGVGSMGSFDTLKSPQLSEGQTYILRGYEPVIDPSLSNSDRCFYDFQFTYTRDSFPPQDALYVDFFEDELQSCETFGDSAKIKIWEEGIRDKYAPFHLQWYRNNEAIPGKKYEIVVIDTGLYRAKVTDSLGCWGYDEARVTSVNQSAGPIIPCKVNGSSGIFTFVWPEGIDIAGNEVSLDGGNTWEAASNGDYHVIPFVQDQKFIVGRGVVQNACGYTEISTSMECPDNVYPPNIITPNDDGMNDVFEIDGLELYENSAVEVFDRWGNLVFTSDNYKNDWNGDDLPEGTYFYVLEVDDPEGTVHKGILTLLR